MQPRQLLVIDDEDDIREVARMSLELTESWRVNTANGGAAGITLARSIKPDAILLDMVMPEMDGPSTFQALQEQTAAMAIPVILLTAKVQTAGREKFIALGARGIIVKPFDPLALGQQIRDALAWPAAGALTDSKDTNDAA